MIMEFNWRKIMEDYNVWRYLSIISSVSAIYIAWIVLHYMSSHLYVSWCVPATIIGFITAPFLVPAPHCQALRWCIYTGGERIFAMWVMIGTWLFNQISRYSDTKKD
jgi:hypothetical protein